MNTDQNPYAPPTVDPVLQTIDPTALQLATLSERFAGAFFDGLVGALVVLPMWGLLIATGFVDSFRTINTVGAGYNILMGLASFSVIMLIQFHFLKSTGQTIGKKLAKTKIVTMSGEKPQLIDLIAKRYAFMKLIGLIPVVGGVVSLVSVLFVFRKDRRCIHDLIAGTQVVKMTS